jgi:hypothetical protein
MANKRQFSSLYRVKTYLTSTMAECISEHTRSFWMGMPRIIFEQLISAVQKWFYLMELLELYFHVSVGVCVCVHR